MFRCSGLSCPGLPYRASEVAHPASCAMRPAVVVLEVAWGGGARWFRINPMNFTGKRLYAAFGSHPFLVTNACPEIVEDATGRGEPDPEYLRRNLRDLNPRYVLVCGAVAQRTFSSDMVSEDCIVQMERHPASRNWTRAELDALRDSVQGRLS